MKKCVASLFSYMYFLIILKRYFSLISQCCSKVSCFHYAFLQYCEVSWLYWQVAAVTWVKNYFHPPRFPLLLCQFSGVEGVLLASSLWSVYVSGLLACFCVRYSVVFNSPTSNSIHLCWWCCCFEIQINCRLWMLVCTELVVSWHSWKMRSDMSCNSRSQFTNSGMGRLSTWLHATENYVYLHQFTLKIIWQVLNLFWLFGCCGPSPLTCKKRILFCMCWLFQPGPFHLQYPTLKKKNKTTTPFQISIFIYRSQCL